MNTENDLPDIIENIRDTVDQRPIEPAVSLAGPRQKKPLICRDGRWIDADGHIHAASESQPSARSEQ